MPTFTPDRAVDGSSVTRWSSEFSDPQWIAIDLGGPFSVTRVVLRWESAYSSEYQLLISDDGQNWRTVLTKSKNSADVDDLERLGRRPLHRHLQPRRGTPWGMSLWEFEVYGVAGRFDPDQPGAQRRDGGVILVRQRFHTQSGRGR